MGPGWFDWLSGASPAQSGFGVVGPEGGGPMVPIPGGGEPIPWGGGIDPSTGYPFGAPADAIAGAGAGAGAGAVDPLSGAVPGQGMLMRPGGPDPTRPPPMAPPTAPPLAAPPPSAAEALRLAGPAPAPMPPTAPAGPPRARVPVTLPGPAAPTPPAGPTAGAADPLTGAQDLPVTPGGPPIGARPGGRPSQVAAAIPPIGRPRTTPGDMEATAVAGEAAGQPEIDPVTVAMAGAEGVGRNQNSTADGTGQFTRRTWLSMVQRFGERYGVPPALIERARAGDREAQGQLLNLRQDPELGLRMTELYRRENVEALRRAGFQDPGPTEQYLAHFLGADGAIRFLRARAENPNLPVDQAVSREALEANVYRNRQGQPTSSPFYDIGPNRMRVRTVDEVYGWAGSTLERNGLRGRGRDLQMASAGGGAGGAGAPQQAGAQDPLAAPGTPLRQDDAARRMLLEALNRMNKPDTTPEERQQAQRERWGRMLMEMGGSILAANQPSALPRSPIGEGLGRGMQAAARTMGEDRRERRAERQAARGRDAQIISAAASMRPRLVSAGGAVYRDDPLSGAGPEQVAQAPETWHPPTTLTRPDNSQVVLQTGSRGGVREIGQGSVSRSGGAGAAEPAVVRTARAIQQFARDDGREISMDQAMQEARSRQADSPATQRQRAISAAQRYRDPNTGQALPIETQTKIADALTQFYRDGNAEALQAAVREALPQQRAPQPGLISRLLGLGGGESTPQPAAPAGPPSRGTVEAAPRPGQERPRARNPQTGEEMQWNPTSRRWEPVSR